MSYDPFVSEEASTLDQKIAALLESSHVIEQTIEELMHKKMEHHHTYLNRIRLQYNEALHTNKKTCLVDLVAALSKARQINVQIVKELKHQKWLLKETDAACNSYIDELFVLMQKTSHNCDQAKQ